jgi:hypothetical protein
MLGFNLSLICNCDFRHEKKKIDSSLGLEFPFCTYFWNASMWKSCIIYKCPKLYILVLVPLCLLDHADGVDHVKLYVAPVSRTATEADVSYHFPRGI